MAGGIGFSPLATSVFFSVCFSLAAFAASSFAFFSRRTSGFTTGFSLAIGAAAVGVTGFSVTCSTSSDSSAAILIVFLKELGIQ